MAKTLSFRGKEKGDFAYYVAKSLASNNFSVAVIDNSISKDLFETVHQSADNNSFYEKESIVYLKDVSVDESFTDKFDYVIYYFGLNTEVVSTEFSFVINDYSMTNVSQIVAFGKEALEDAKFIFRDKVSNKVSEKNLALLLGIKNEQILGVLPLSDKDEVAYLNLGYNGRQRIKDVSQDMQFAVMDVLALVTGDELKDIKKYYRKAKRNKRL